MRGASSANSRPNLQATLIVEEPNLRTIRRLLTFTWTSVMQIHRSDGGSSTDFETVEPIPALKLVTNRGDSAGLNS